MRIDRLHLISFLEAIKIGGDIKIDEAVFNFTERGLEVVSDIPYNVGQVRALITSSFFEDYVQYDKVGIDSLLEFTNILKHFRAEEINISIEGAALMITSSDKQMMKQLVDPQYIPVTKILELPDYKSMFELSATQISQLRSEAKSNKCETIIISSIPGEVTFSDVGRHTVNTKIKSETCNEEQPTQFNGKIVLELLANNTKECTTEIWFGHDLPLVINFKTKNIKLQYILLRC